MSEATDAELLVRQYHLRLRNIDRDDYFMTIPLTDVRQLIDALETALAEKQAAIKERDEWKLLTESAEYKTGKLIKERDEARAEFMVWTEEIKHYTGVLAANAKLIEENRVLREGIAIVYKQGRCGCGGYGYHDADCAHKKLRETIVVADVLRDKK